MAILGPLALEIAPQETVALTGASGIGKTTLLRAMAGLIRPLDGTRAAPPKIAMVFQEPVLLPWRQVLRNLTIPCRISDCEAREVLETVGLAGLAVRYPAQLSLGQQRRLALARAFAFGAPLLLMDEPFVSLDSASAEAAIRTYEALRARHRISTVLVTHSADEVARLADRELRLQGRPAQLRSL